MSKYKVEVVMTYWQSVEIYADSKAEAEATALDQFDINQGGTCDGEAHATEIIEGEQNAND